MALLPQLLAWVLNILGYLPPEYKPVATLTMVFGSAFEHFGPSASLLQTDHMRELASLSLLQLRCYSVYMLTNHYLVWQLATWPTWQLYLEETRAD